MNESVKILFGLIGGLALFLYGMNSMSDALQKAAGEKMKKIVLCMIAGLLSFGVQAQDKYAEIKFDATSFDFGKFYSDAGKQSHTFTFTNTGNMPLIINQAMTSCGCTVSTYTKEPVAPGKTGTVNVTYNGLGKFPGKFKKSVTLRTNSKTPMVRLYIEGNMEERK